MSDNRNSRRNVSSTALLAAVLFIAAAFDCGCFRNNETSDVPPKMDPMNYASDVSLALCDLT